MEPYINQVTLETFPLYYSIVSLFCIWMLYSSSCIALTCKYYAPTFLFQVISYDLTCLLVVLYAKKFWGWSAIHCHCVPHKVPWPSHGSSSSLLSAPFSRTRRRAAHQYIKKKIAACTSAVTSIHWCCSLCENKFRQ